MKQHVLVRDLHYSAYYVSLLYCLYIDNCTVFNVTAVEHKCPGEHVYTECGSACPRTCQNKDDQILCIELCRGIMYNYCKCVNDVNHVYVQYE